MAAPGQVHGTNYKSWSYREPVARLIEKTTTARPERRVKEEERIQKLADKRKNGRRRAEKRQRKREGPQKGASSSAKCRRLNFRLWRVLNGRDLVIDGEPRRSSSAVERAQMLSKFHAAWIDKSEMQLAKMDVEAMTLFRSAGCWRVFTRHALCVRQTRINDEVWRHSTIKLKSTCESRCLSDNEETQHLRDYKKFRTSSRMWDGEMKP